MKQLLDLKDSVNTHRVVKWSAAAFLELLGENCQFKYFSKPELSEHLKRFFASVRCLTGENVKSTLNSYRY